MNICFTLPCNYISNKYSVTILAKSLQTIKDAVSISALWKAKIWAAHPSSLRACIIALSIFPSPLEKLCLFVAISLSVKSLFLSWQEEFYSTRLLQTEFFLKLTFYYIHFSTLAIFPAISSKHALTISSSSLYKTRMFPGAWSFA